MYSRCVRAVCAVICLLALSGCESIKEKWPQWRLALTQPASNVEPLATSGSVPPIDEATPEITGRIATDDDLSRAKQHFRAQNLGLAEQHFRRAVEGQPQAAEAWIGLAATYDRLKRFDLADRAYDKAIALIGPTPEILNNQGYSYILRGDTRKAHAKLKKAIAKAPDNPYVQNNQALLKSVERGETIE